MKNCLICNNPCVHETVHLRNGDDVCLSCIRRLGEQISKYEATRPPRNEWDIIGYVLIPSFIFLCIYSLIKVHILASLALGIMGAWLYGLISKQSEKIKEPLRNAIKEKIKDMRDQLNFIYERYPEIPPDWENRREQVFKRDKGRCQKCGRNKYRSKVPFHIHHVIPRSEKEGYHSLENLIVLCEICHSKTGGRGHSLIKGSRNQRLKRKRRSSRRHL